MRVLTVALCSLLCLAVQAAEAPKEIVRRALKNSVHSREAERSYTFVERHESRTLDGSGKVKHTESRTWDVVPLQGSQFRKLIQHDDKPLTPKEEKEQEAVRLKSEAERQKRAELRAKETPEQRQKRIETRDRKRKESEDEMDEVVEGFDLRLVGEEKVDGVPVWVIEGAPRKGFRFKSKSTTNVLSKLKGRVWVTQSDYQIVRIDAETVDTISFGLFLARIYKGTQLHVEFTHVNGEIWLPRNQSYRVQARMLVLKGIHQEGDATFSNYKKFSTDSRIIEDSQDQIED